MIFLFYLKATKDQALERHFNLLTGLWKAPPVRFGCHGTVNGVYLLNGKREPRHRSHLREKMAVDITAGTEHYPSVKENGDFLWMWIICFTATISSHAALKQKDVLFPALRHWDLGTEQPTVTFSLD